MADRAVDLPQPHPDDAEDVVDWLSTASTLWARGERADSLVWLRRAAQAAAAAGQPFRASEIGMYVTALEETFGELPVGAGVSAGSDTDASTPEAPAQDALRNKMPSVDVDVVDEDAPDSSPAAFLAKGMALGPAQVARVAPPGAAKPPPPPPPVRDVRPAKVVVQVASVPPTGEPSGSSTAEDASSDSSPAFLPRIDTPLSEDGEETTLVTGMLRGVALKKPTGKTVPPPVSAAAKSAPSAPPPAFAEAPLAVPRPPPTPSGEAFSAIRDRAMAKSSSASAPPPPLPQQSSGTRPPPAPSARGSSRPPRASSSNAPGASSAPGASRQLPSRRPAQRVPREPILDPWSEEEVARAKPVLPVPTTGSEDVVVFRARIPSIHDEEDVFTSAAPLPPALRKHPPSTSSTGRSAPPAPLAPPVPPPAPSASPAPPPLPTSSSQERGRLQNIARVASKSVPPPPKSASADSTTDASDARSSAERPAIKEEPAGAVTTKRPVTSIPRPRASTPPSAMSSKSVPAPASKSVPPRPLTASVRPLTSRASPSKPPTAEAPSAGRPSAPPAPVTQSAKKSVSPSRPPQVALATNLKSATPSPPASAPPTVKSRPPPPPVAAPEPSAPAAQPTFDPLRATLPMVLEIEPRPVDLPSMRATIPMDLGLPKQVEDFFAEQEDDPVELEGVNLGEVDLFKGMPRATLEMLAEKAECMELDADEEVGGFGGALLLAGSAVLCATIVDAAAHWLAPSELIVTQGSLADSMATRVVGAAEGAGVAVWPRDVLDEAFAVLPASSKRARACGDRMQALVGVTMGPFGELEDDQRRALLGELNVTYLRPGEIWLEDGAPAPPLALVGAGEVEIYGPISDDTSEVVEPGALVFPELAGVGGEATTSARAGSHGALLLTADRKATERMTEVVPNLAAILRGD